MREITFFFVTCGANVVIAIPLAATVAMEKHNEMKDTDVTMAHGSWLSYIDIVIL